MSADYAKMKSIQQQNEIAAFEEIMPMAFLAFILENQRHSCSLDNIRKFFENSTTTYCYEISWNFYDVRSSTSTTN